MAPQYLAWPPSNEFLVMSLLSKGIICNFISVQSQTFRLSKQENILEYFLATWPQIKKNYIKFKKVLKILKTAKLIINYKIFTQILGSFKTFPKSCKKFEKILIKLLEKLTKYCWKFEKTIENKFLKSLLNLKKCALN